MIGFKKYNCALLSICSLLTTLTLSAQDCDSNYFAYSYTASDFLTFSKALVTPDSNVLCLQTNRLYYHGLTKFTPGGNVIFSYQYTAPFAANGNHPWTDLAFTDMAIGPESACYLSGSVTKHGVFFDNTEVPPPRTAAVIAKTDKYGNVLWSRFFANATTDPLSFSNIITLANGDIAAYLTTAVAHPFYGRLVCLSGDGTIKWMTTLNTGDFSSGAIDFPKKVITQTRNGNIVVGDVVYKYDTNFNNGEYHFLALNASTGLIAWESSYAYDDPLFVPNISGAAELPDGSLSFQTTTNIATAGDPLGVSKELNIITDDKGNIKKMITLHPANDFIGIIDAKPDGSSGNQALLLLSSDQKPVVTQIDKDGNIKWSRKYGKTAEDAQPLCFVKANNGYDVFLGSLAKSFRMLRTDPAGRLDCDSMAVNMIQETIPSFHGNTNNIHTSNIPGVNDPQLSTGFFVVQNTVSTAIRRSTVCQKNIPCCIDVVDTTNIHAVALCEGGAYQLPDKTIVSDSGMYYASYKTSKGCDSVSLYKVSIYKNPAALSLGLDTCLHKNDSLILRATDGYNSYTWMNALPTTASHYKVYQPGIYTVNVSNVCGSKTDTVQVYDQCDFPIYMPGAFTPNGDFLNDVFKVPASNLNRLILLTIYNRWGGVIFQTSSSNKGWDGTVKGNPQQAGLYLYDLQMENLIGKRIHQAGTVVLIR